MLFTLRWRTNAFFAKQYEPYAFNSTVNAYSLTVAHHGALSLAWLSLAKVRGGPVRVRLFGGQT